MHGAQQQPRTQPVASSDPIEWKDHPRIAPGEYRAYCSWGKQYWDRAFRGWRCMLRWEVLSDDLLRKIARLPMWFALGTGDKPCASRRGKYFPEWVRANGAPPLRNDRLSPIVFVHRMARVQAGDTEGPAPYSVIKRIIEWETGSPGHSVNKSTSQGGPISTGSADTDIAHVACQKLESVSSVQQWNQPDTQQRVQHSTESALAGVEGVHSNTLPKGGRRANVARKGLAMTTNYRTDPMDVSAGRGGNHAE